MTKVLEVNVDDNGYGGVYALVKNVIAHKPDSLHEDRNHYFHRILHKEYKHLPSKVD